MEIGFLVDHSYGALLQTKWAEGEPKPSWISGIKTSQVKAGLKVTTYRCPDCGLLESYAFEAERPV